jgi:flavin reductase (DIM6/NTAB) family NADH-FMN oxidoreductase RutF
VGVVSEENDAFERIVTSLEYPMFVVTTVSSDGQRSGCLVGFTTQASINPPRFLIGLSQTNHTFRVAKDASHLAVHVVARDHREIVELFGTETGDEIDKFERCEWTSGPHGLPILSDSAAWFVGAIEERFALCDHVGLLLAPESGEAPENLPKLIEAEDVKGLDPGHDP